MSGDNKKMLILIGILLVIICGLVSVWIVGYGKSKHSDDVLSKTDTESLTEELTEDSSDNVNEEVTEEIALSKRAVHYDTEFTISEERSIAIRDMWLGDLTEEEQEVVKSKMMTSHILLESVLVYRFQQTAPEPDSVLWTELINDPNDSFVGGRYIPDYISDLTEMKEIINKESFSVIADKIIAEFEELEETRDIDLLYKIHQEIHDLSYYAINYPLPEFKVEPPDWHGVYVYFGTLDEVKIEE